MIGAKSAVNRAGDRSGGEEKVTCVQTGDYTGNGQGDAVEGACYLAQASATSSVLSFKKSERFRE